MRNRFVFVRTLFGAMLGLCAIAQAEGKPYTVAIDAPAAKVDAPAKAQVRLTASAGYHVNQEFPTALKLTAPSGVDLSKATITGKDGAKIGENEALFDIAFTAKEAGRKTFSGVINFAVCTATTCDPRREKISFTVDVR